MQGMNCTVGLNFGLVVEQLSLYLNLLVSKP